MCSTHPFGISFLKNLTLRPAGCWVRVIVASEFELCTEIYLLILVDVQFYL